MESDGELMFSWYCMDNVLEPGAAEAMFNDYCAILQAVIAAPESLKTRQRHRRAHSPPTLAAERAGGLRPAGY